MVGTRSCSEHGFRTAYRISYTGSRLRRCCYKRPCARLGHSVHERRARCRRLCRGTSRLRHRPHLSVAEQGAVLPAFAARTHFIGVFAVTRPEGRNFPVRNRIISGLSVAAVIFEANAGSGALITASHALSQGRRIFAVPGDVGDKLYDGPLGLLNDGARW